VAKDYISRKQQATTDLPASSRPRDAPCATGRRRRRRAPAPTPWLPGSHRPSPAQISARSPRPRIAGRRWFDFDRAPGRGREIWRRDRSRGRDWGGFGMRAAQPPNPARPPERLGLRLPSSFGCCYLFFGASPWSPTGLSFLPAVASSRSVLPGWLADNFLILTFF
jgi:hypothetical protein